MTRNDKILDWFDRSLLTDRLARIDAFWQGEERFLVTINSDHELYRQVADEKLMMSKAISNIRHQATLPGISLPVFHADFGTVSVPKHWGAKVFLDSTGQRLNIEPISDSAREALAIETIPVEHPEMDAPRAIRLYNALREELQTDQLWLRMPDPQGPFTIAGLIVRQEQLLMDLYMDPEAVAHLLQKTADVYIDFVGHCRRHTNGMMLGSVWPYTYFPPNHGVTIIEDMMPLLSPEIYATFAPAYLAKISDRLGALHIHCCGRWGQHAPTLAAIDATIKSVEFHYPFTKLDEIMCLAEKVVFVPMILPEKQNDFDSLSSFYEHLIRNTDPAYRYWFTFPTATDEAIRFARKYDF